LTSLYSSTDERYLIFSCSFCQTNEFRNRFLIPFLSFNSSPFRSHKLPPSRSSTTEYASLVIVLSPSSLRSYRGPLEPELARSRNRLFLSFPSLASSILESRQSGVDQDLYVLSSTVCTFPLLLPSQLPLTDSTLFSV